MPQSNLHYELGALLAQGDGSRNAPYRFSAQMSSRYEYRSPGGDTFFTDRFHGAGAECVFLRTAAREEDTDLTLSITAAYRLTAIPAGGWLATSEDTAPTALWIPQSPTLRRIDNDHHILEELHPPLTNVSIDSNAYSLTLKVPAGWQLDLVVWRYSDSDKPLVQRLREPDPVELQPVFLWGSHTNYARPADLYLHLIHGSVYENRRAWPYYWKICSENDAHALFVTLQGIRGATGNPLYDLLKRQLLMSVVARQGADGGWHHGEWTHEMESHFRLHCSAMHMLMDALAEGPDAALGDALRKAAAYLVQRRAGIDAGVWFPHDSLELSEEGMSMSPTPWVRSRAFGKAPSNMLVLNTHLDATIALDRYREITGDASYQGEVQSARSTAKAVLTARPFESLYRLIFALVNLSFLPSYEAVKLPLYRRALKRIGWKYLIPMLPRIKAIWPRLVMPRGYVDRSLTLCSWSDVYLPVNLMDLLRFRRRFDDAYLSKIIEEIFSLDRDLHIRNRWSEQTGKLYGLGFWAESLYHACTLSDARHYRESLAKSVIDLTDHDMGLPPSLFGRNCEAVSPAHQVRSPSPGAQQLRIVNLSRGKSREVLLVNVGEVPISIHNEEMLTHSWQRLEGSGGDRLEAKDLAVPARDWVLASSHGASS